MKEYNFSEIEKKWQNYWRENNIYKVTEDETRPKYYVLDMFPYPSGAGLHVGHPLGYIASDIYARYKRLKGFNVLHPMGYDAFGLPAEQYAIQTGQHPAITTEQNIKRYREQLDKIGFCYDWDREVKTSDPAYYKWTQWIFIKLFHSFYNTKTDRAEPVENLIHIFEAEGFHDDINQTFTGNIEHDVEAFSASDWKSYNEKTRQNILMNFRLAYLAESYVNWCPAMGTVLANDEVKDGISERGGYPVERKLMMQWSLRITVYADRLLKDLETIDWTESLKEAQKNWIGKSEGTSIKFKLEGDTDIIEVFTTRPDTVFGVSFLTLAPEHELVEKLTIPSRKEVVKQYVAMAKNRGERERMADVKKISGEFTGSYAIHPFTGKQLSVWIGDYVLAGYGTGAVMAVPAHDSRDFAFAKHFGLERPVVMQPELDWDFADQSFDEKNGKAVNSDFLNGLETKDAIKKAIAEIEKRNLGKGRTNFRLRDAIFGRQRYWGEPIPIYYKDGIPYTLDEKDLPLVLPEVDKYLPTESGEPPLARAANWKYKEQYDYETTTMPGWAGSSWYFLRYMDNKNSDEFVSKEAVDYWKQVDLYIGGSEHATGHLLYVRFWTKFLFDLGLIPMNEPAKKLINQGMIQGRSNFVYRFEYGIIDAEGKLKSVGSNIFLSFNLAEKIANGTYSPLDFKELVIQQKGEKFAEEYPFLFSGFLGVSPFQEGLRFEGENLQKRTPIYVDVNLIKNDKIDIHNLRKSRDVFKEGEFITEQNGEFICGIIDNEKMSKSKYNVITPDNIIENYGADTLRLYEMFLGPLEQSKPWNTQGIEGVHRYLKKLWKLFYLSGESQSAKSGDTGGNPIISNEEPSKKEWKTLHKLIKKVGEDIENFSFNTSVPAFMICVNELTDLKCNKKKILQDYLICLSPYAPHIAEELWSVLGNTTSIVNSQFPILNSQFLIEDSFSYPISINGKHRTNIEMGMEMENAEVEKLVVNDETVQKWLEGKQPKKIVFVKGRIINVVV